MAGWPFLTFISPEGGDDFFQTFWTQGGNQTLGIQGGRHVRTLKILRGVSNLGDVFKQYWQKVKSFSE